MEWGRWIFFYAMLFTLSGTGQKSSISYAAGLDCLIRPYSVADVSSPVGGIVEHVTVDRGDFVEKGQILFRLESGLQESEVAIARARSKLVGAFKSGKQRLKFINRKMVRNEELFRENLVSINDIEELEAEKVLTEMRLLDATEKRLLSSLELQRARTALALRTTRSPLDGVVVERFFNPGEYANEKPILKIAQIDPLKVEVFVPVSLLGRISVGMKARVIPEKPLKDTFVGRVTVIDRVIDAASGTFVVRVELKNPDYLLTAGLKCQVQFLKK